MGFYWSYTHLYSSHPFLCALLLNLASRFVCKRQKEWWEPVCTQSYVLYPLSHRVRRLPRSSPSLPWRPLRRRTGPHETKPSDKEHRKLAWIQQLTEIVTTQLVTCITNQCGASTRVFHIEFMRDHVHFTRYFRPQNWRHSILGGTSKQFAKVFSAKTKTCIFHQFAKFSFLIVSRYTVQKDSIPKIISLCQFWVCLAMYLQLHRPHVPAGSDSACICNSIDHTYLQVQAQHVSATPQTTRTCRFRLSMYLQLHRPHVPVGSDSVFSTSTVINIHCYIHVCMTSRLMNSRGYLYQWLFCSPQTQTNADRTRHSCSTCTPLPRLCEWYVCCVVGSQHW